MDDVIRSFLYFHTIVKVPPNHCRKDEIYRKCINKETQVTQACITQRQLQNFVPVLTGILLSLLKAQWCVKAKSRISEQVQSQLLAL